MATDALDGGACNPSAPVWAATTHRRELDLAEPQAMVYEGRRRAL